MKIIALFISQMAFAMNVAPAPFPVFLKEGFSSILEFEEAPTQVVLGDQNLFQVEKLNHSIVIKPLAPYATTNMFVYFKNKETRLFILSASDDNEPTYFKKFATIVPPKPVKDVGASSVALKRNAIVRNSLFDKKKDYLTIDFEISSDSKSKIIPDWDGIRLKYRDNHVSPSKVWSERREVQKDSRIRARLIFTKPNLPIDLKGVSMVIPVKGETKALSVALKASHP